MNSPINPSANQEIVPSGDLGSCSVAERPVTSSYELAPYWKEVKEKLVCYLQEPPALDLCECFTPLAQVLEIVRIEECVCAPVVGRRGRKQIDRRPLARAFLAKAFLNLADTRQLVHYLEVSPSLRLLCGMEKVASEPTFSRAFSQFAADNLGDTVHAAMVSKFVSGQIVMHCSHDTTAVEAREKAAKKKKNPEMVPKKSEVVLRRERFDLRKSQLV